MIATVVDINIIEVYVQYYLMEGRRFEQHLQMFMNEPALLKHYLERNNPSNLRAEKLKTIFPPNSQLQRFRHLEHARKSAQRDLELDGCVGKLIANFQQKVAINAKADRQIQQKKQMCLGKLKMDYVQEQMSQNLQQLQKLIKDYEYYSGLIGGEKQFVERMIMMTEIKKALAIQNSILKKQNEMLKKQEEEIDSLINKRKK